MQPVTCSCEAKDGPLLICWVSLHSCKGKEVAESQQVKAVNMGDNFVGWGALMPRPGCTLVRALDSGHFF